MDPFPIPEIKRVPLESIALTLKVVHNDVKVCVQIRRTKGSQADTLVKSFLSRAIDPPDISAVDKALSVLEELAAMAPDGELTALGRHMVRVPSHLNPRALDQFAT